MNPASDFVDQARVLLDMVKTGLAASAAGATSGTTAGKTADGEGRHADDCRWCPVCQAKAVVRGERPEVTAALADVLTAAATTLRSFAEADRPSRTDRSSRTERAHERGAGAADPPPVLHRVDIA